MKSKLFSTLALSATVLALNAQMSMPSTTGIQQDAQKSAVQTKSNATQTVAKAETTAKPALGSLISQFSGQISPTALTDDFNKNKSSFETQAKSTPATDVKANAGLLQKLQGGLKSTAFTSGWAAIKDKWQAGVKGATSTKQLAGYAKTLTENVNPKFLGSNWEKIKPTLTSALDKAAQ